VDEARGFEALSRRPRVAIFLRRVGKEPDHSVAQRKASARHDMGLRV
jgi:hypothetical protein